MPDPQAAFRMPSDIDPQYEPWLWRVAAVDLPPFEAITPAQAREQNRRVKRWLQDPLEPVARVEEHRLPGPAGEIPVRLYAPAGAGPFGALLYFHGGGWVVGDLDTHDHLCRALARRAGGIVLAVDYRRAPEHPFPAAVEDAYAAARWAHEHGAAVGIDPERIALAGDSAGGNLSAVVSLLTRERGGPSLCLQIPIYGVMNLASFETPSYHDYAQGYDLDRSRMAWYRERYLSDPQDAHSPLASPLLAEDLSALPPAFVVTAECDVLRDEGEAYARRLEEAGVPCTLKRYPGMMHGFFAMANVLDRAREALDDVGTALRAAWRVTS